LYENIIFYNYCRRKNGRTMLNSADHDSISGEPIGTTSVLVITSGKLGIWPLVAPENKGFRKMKKFPREGKDPGKKIFFDIWHMGGGRTLSSMLGK
jgi:hypothetical protein